MDFIRCLNKNCPHLYKREMHGFSDYMCCARKGRKVRETDLGSGRLIRVERLKECPLENPKKHFHFDKNDH